MKDSHFQSLCTDMVSGVPVNIQTVTRQPSHFCVGCLHQKSWDSTSHSDLTSLSLSDADSFEYTTSRLNTSTNSWRTTIVVYHIFQSRHFQGALKKNVLTQHQTGTFRETMTTFKFPENEHIMSP